MLQSHEIIEKVDGTLDIVLVDESRKKVKLGEASIEYQQHSKLKIFYITVHLQMCLHYSSVGRNL